MLPGPGRAGRGRRTYAVPHPPAATPTCSHTRLISIKRFWESDHHGRYTTYAFNLLKTSGSIKNKDQSKTRIDQFFVF